MPREMSVKRYTAIREANKPLETSHLKYLNLECHE